MDTTTCSSSSSSCYSLEITIMSAESLTMAAEKPIRKNLFVFISTEEDYPKKQQLRTNISQDLAWHEKLIIDVPMHAKFIILEVRHASRSREKSVGVAKVPITDFVGSSISTPNNYLHFLSYRLRDRYREPNGIINFSIEVLKEKGFDYQHYNFNKHGGSEITGFRYGENSVTKPWNGTVPLVGDRRNSSHVVVGVPTAWYNSCPHVSYH